MSTEHVGLLSPKAQRDIALHDQWKSNLDNNLRLVLANGDLTPPARIKKCGEIITAAVYERVNGLPADRAVLQDRLKAIQEWLIVWSKTVNVRAKKNQASLTQLKQHITQLKQHIDGLTPNPKPIGGGRFSTDAIESPTRGTHFDRIVIGGRYSTHAIEGQPMDARFKATGRICSPLETIPQDFDANFEAWNKPVHPPKSVMQDLHKKLVRVSKMATADPPPKAPWWTEQAETHNDSLNCTDALLGSLVFSTRRTSLDGAPSVFHEYVRGEDMEYMLHRLTVTNDIYGMYYFANYALYPLTLVSSEGQHMIRQNRQIFEPLFRAGLESQTVKPWIEKFGSLDETQKAIGDFFDNRITLSELAILVYPDGHADNLKTWVEREHGLTKEGWQAFQKKIDEWASNIHKNSEEDYRKSVAQGGS
ncbi:hypothetical protein ACFL6C_10210 [Myxococcota bacterium]